MKIVSYSFGNIIIDEKKYNKDLIIINDKIIANWWRKKSHLLQLSDLQEFLRDEIQIVIVGTGKFGMMKIDKKLIEFIQNKQIKMISEKTAKALEIYSSEKNKKNVLCALHLTC